MQRKIEELSKKFSKTYRQDILDSEVTFKAKEVLVEWAFCEGAKAVLNSVQNILKAPPLKLK